MKKLLSLALAAVMTLSLGVTAVAAPADTTNTTDARLTAVTAKVKETLALDTTAYTKFNGQLSENAVNPTWSLRWNTEDGTALSITTQEDGKVLSYSHSAAQDTPQSTDHSIPTFPAVTQEVALATAQSFLDKALTKGVETATLTLNQWNILSSTQYRYNGTILLNGLPSPLTFSITVDGTTGDIIRFYRNDGSGNYMGGVPSATTAVTQNAALQLLRDTLSLHAEYVLNEDNTASLLYLPQDTDEFYVDGVSGKLVNLTELYASLRAGNRSLANMNGESAPAPSAAPELGRDGLSAVEQAGIAQLEGVLAKETIDRTLKDSWSALGLGKYTLAGASYRMVDDTDTSKTPAISCTLTYTQKIGDTVKQRMVTADARTGALQDIYSLNDYEEVSQRVVSVNQAEKTAQSFLNAFDSNSFEKAALLTTENAMDSKYSVNHTFTYAQKIGDFFYPGNYLTISVDAQDGTVSGLTTFFDHDVVFNTPETVLSLTEITDKYLEILTCPLSYSQVPQALNLADSGVRPLLEELGYGYFMALKLGYTLEEDSSLIGLDAATGEAVLTETDNPDTALTYTDLDTSWAKTQAEALAAYGIGFYGNTLRTGETLTQLDLMALLASVDGYYYVPQTENAANDLYESFVYPSGLLTKAQREDGKAITRGELVKLLLDKAGYHKIANLSGIFRCSFADESTIPADQYGYAALAQGLGLVKGDGMGRYAASRTATRGEGIAMLYQYMGQ